MMEVALCLPYSLDTYRLHQDVVFAVQEGGPGVLVEGLHVVSGREGQPVIHAAAGMPLLDLGKSSGRGKGRCTGAAAIVVGGENLAPCSFSGQKVPGEQNSEPENLPYKLCPKTLSWETARCNGICQLPHKWGGGA